MHTPPAAAVDDLAVLDVHRAIAAEERLLGGIVVPEGEPTGDQTAVHSMAKVGVDDCAGAVKTGGGATCYM